MLFQTSLIVHTHTQLLNMLNSSAWGGAHRWWQRAEKPWQCLAGCMEVRNALASGHPPSFQSRLPVQMDGSCNGLQHYAALGRDFEGGSSVNLTPSSCPQVRRQHLAHVSNYVLCDGQACSA